MLKTYEGWGKSNMGLCEYLQVGDTVNQEMYSHFINVMPPRTFRENLVQIGGAYSISKEGKSTYTTIEKINGKWIYKGNCHAGESNNQSSMY